MTLTVRWRNIAAAEKLGTDVAHTHEDVGRVLLAKKDDVDGAIAELKQAEALAPSDWNIHDLYVQALVAPGQMELAITEFRAAVALDPKQLEVVLELGLAPEKKGDLVGALEQDRNASLAEASANRKHQPGEAFVLPTEAQKEYKAAQLRFADYVASLKAEGKNRRGSRPRRANAHARHLGGDLAESAGGDGGWARRRSRRGASTTPRSLIKRR